MPFVTGDAGGVLVRIDWQELRPFGSRLPAYGGMNMQFAEATAESEVLFRRDILIAEEHDLIFVHSVLDEPGVVVRQIVTKIDPEKFCTDDRVEGAYRNGIPELYHRFILI